MCETHFEGRQALGPDVEIPVATSEFDLWRSANGLQKSYLVNVLHWFHYRPRRLQSSWKQEEVLTWELIRALEILPQRLFARPLIEHLGTLNPPAQRASQRMLQAPMVEVTPYPSLELQGGKRNCKSDIGLGVPAERPSIWIEAKTARFSAVKLRNQLDQQANAMASLFDENPYALVTLLPTNRTLEEYPNLSWDTVVSILQSCLSSLSRILQEEDLFRGYWRIAEELIGRIQSHPNRAEGWV